MTILHNTVKTKKLNILERLEMYKNHDNPSHVVNDHLEHLSPVHSI